MRYVSGRESSNHLFSYVQAPCPRYPIATSLLADPASPVRFAEAVLSPAADSGVAGNLGLVQNGDGPVVITGRIGGLRAGRHGFHVHAEGSITNDCLDAAGHFNPFSVSRKK